MELKAALGIAQMIIDPSTLRFQEVGVGGKKIMMAAMWNSGTATCHYTAQHDWKYSEHILLPPDFKYEGDVPAGSRLEFPVTFAPQLEADFFTDIFFNTSVGQRVLSIHGIAYHFAIQEGGLPKNIVYDEMRIGSFRDFDMEIENGCLLDLDLMATVTNPNTLTSSIYVKVEPTESFKIPRNEPDSVVFKMNNIVLKCGISPPVDSSGSAMPDFFAKVPLFTPINEILRITHETSAAISYTIPVSFAFSIDKLLLKNTLDIEEVEYAPSTESIEFGLVVKVSNSRTLNVDHLKNTCCIIRTPSKSNLN